MTSKCDFCERDRDLKRCIFYEKGKWFAFLSAPPHPRGHTILAAKSKNGECPQEMNKKNLSEVDMALDKVREAIQKAYDPLDLLLVSVRGDIKHFHFHIVPLWPEDEQCWRKVTGYKKAHLMEFLGSLEKKHDFLVRECEAKEKICSRCQRAESTHKMAGEIKKLREITGYSCDGN